MIKIVTLLFAIETLLIAVEPKTDTEQLRAMAIKGDANSQYELAHYYHLKSTIEDSKEAFKWFLAAAKNNHVLSQKYIGIYYIHGQGTVKDLKKANFWLSKAADKGNARAIYWLGYLKQLKNEKEEAFKLYQKAAKKGDYVSIIVVADHYKKGEIVNQDLDKALSLYRKALAKQPNPTYKKIILRAINEINE